MTLSLHDLVACNVEMLEERTSEWAASTAIGSTTTRPRWQGTYTLSFTIPEPGTEGIRSFTGPLTRDGVTLHSLTATPAAAKLEIQLPSRYSTQVKLTAADGTLLKAERGEGVHLDENDSNSDYLWTYYFDTVPESSPHRDGDGLQNGLFHPARHRGSADRIYRAAVLNQNPARSLLCCGQFLLTKRPACD